MRDRAQGTTMPAQWQWQRQPKATVQQDVRLQHHSIRHRYEFCRYDFRIEDSEFLRANRLLACEQGPRYEISKKGAAMTSRWQYLLRFRVGLLLGALLVPPTIGATEAPELLDKIGISRGICVVLGDACDKVAMDLARASDLLVYVQVANAEQATAARQAAEAMGLDATQLQIEQGDPSRLHLASNLANVVVVLGAESPTTESEILRVLRPRGRAWIGDKELTKPVPPGTDDWTHPYHGADNNPLSQDKNIIAPYLTQFLADPRYGPAPQVAVSAGGRVFKAYGNVAWHEREEPFLNMLVAYDGYNGTLLWKYKLPDGMMVHRNVFVATPDVVYVGDDKSCKQINAVTGEVMDEIQPPEDVAGGTFWKWMALEGDTLYAVVGEQELKDEPVRWKRTEHGWPWDAISRGYNLEEQPWGYGHERPGHQYQDETSHLGLPRERADRQSRGLHVGRSRFRLSLRRLPDLSRCRHGTRRVAENPGERSAPLSDHRSVPAPAKLADKLAHGGLSEMHQGCTLLRRHADEQTACPVDRRRPHSLGAPLRQLPADLAARRGVCDQRAVG